MRRRVLPADIDCVHELDHGWSGRWMICLDGHTLEVTPVDPAHNKRNVSLGEAEHLSHGKRTH